MRICLVGYGVSNKALLENILLKENYEVFVSNNKPLKKEDKYLLDLHNIQYEEEHGKLLRNCDLAILSPGVKPDSEVVKVLKTSNIKISTEIEFAWNYIKKHNPEAVFVGITGTNGKSTTTQLTGHILSSTYNTFVCGNIGTPLSSAPLDKEIYVVEVSSFQLFWGSTFTPEISVLLNLMPDHLNWHSSLEEYYNTKINMVKRTVMGNGMAFVNANLRGYFDNLQRIVLFGENGNIVWKNNMIEAGNIVININNLSLQFELYQEDVMAAVGVALNLDISKNVIEEFISTFKTLEHRLEFIEEYNGIRFFNDSKATNAHAAYSAYKSFRNKGYIAMLSGIPKNEDMTMLLEELQQYAKKTIVFGKMVDEIKKYEFFNNYIITDTFEKAFELALEWSERGDSIILSPAGASFDLFENYKERGRVFKEAVKSLKWR
ncbi:hypothetical protein XO10_05695 [Marinitoga sp. 1135]|uniref:UDP-N-acetylmuramoyl-L-alanine--D-glutamate ligase n=1 Tax=Marinitoga sp. 1135 TaxID=1643333 RepID=UPI001586C7A4|nr:UDP-N-acetylmuramoyl-L-alanine--D-glutamate ligase [Marinitoga sp. 1135]NUU95763.1 hypothetical protein [Marinitoga sp. 1135]